MVGGEEAEENSLPWMAALGARLTNGDNYWFCGGSFIGQRLVLTAAHCIPELGAGYSLDLVRLGAHDLSQDTEVGAVDYRVERRANITQYVTLIVRGWRERVGGANIE